MTPLHMQKFINALSEQKTLHHTIIAASTNLDFPKASLAYTDILDEKGVKKLLECLENKLMMWKVLILYAEEANWLLCNGKILTGLKNSRLKSAKVCII